MKEIKIKKSQLFEQFHRSLLARSAGLDKLVLQVWENSEQANEHYVSRGEFYPNGGPIAQLTYKGLCEDLRQPVQYYLSKRDVEIDILENTPAESIEKIEYSTIRETFESVNPRVLEDLWQNRKQETEVSETQRIQIEWIDDTEALDFLERKYPFYNRGGDTQ